jgi:hypothetical protein
MTTTFFRAASMLAVVAGATLGLAAGAAAQSRVAIRPAPKPGEAIQITAHQEILLRTGPNAEEPGPAQMRNSNEIAYTQKNGTFDAQGRLEAQITVERLTLDESMGGRPRNPSADPATVAGRVLLATFDRTGKLLSLKVPPEIDRNLSARMTQLLAGAYGMLNFIPVAELKAGEETTMTSELPMRLPGGTAQQPLEAKVNVTLRAVDRQGRDRIAHLQQAIDVTTSTSQVKVTGGGTMDVNLERGFMSAADTEWRIAGTMPSPNGAAASGTPFFGSIKIRVNAH